MWPYMYSHCVQRDKMKLATCDKQYVTNAIHKTVLSFPTGRTVWVHAWAHAGFLQFLGASYMQESKHGRKVTIFYQIGLPYVPPPPWGRQLPASKHQEKVTDQPKGVNMITWMPSVTYYLPILGRMCKCECSNVCVCMYVIPSLATLVFDFWRSII